MPGLASLLAELTCGDDESAEAAAGLLPEYGAAAFVALQDLRLSRRTDTRWWAVRALAGWPSSAPVTRELIGALDDEAGEVRQCAAVALSRHPDPQAIPALIRALSISDSLTAKLVANALIRIGAPAVPELLQLLQNGKHVARLEAVRALAEIEDPRAIPALMKLLGEDSAVMEYWAGHGLDRLGLGMLYLKPQ